MFDCRRLLHWNKSCLEIKDLADSLATALHYIPITSTTLGSGQYVGNWSSCSQWWCAPWRNILLNPKQGWLWPSPQGNSTRGQAVLHDLFGFKQRRLVGCLLTVPVSTPRRRRTACRRARADGADSQLLWSRSAAGAKAQIPDTARGDGSNRSTTAHSNGDSTETEETEDASQLRERLEQLRGVQQLCLVILAEYLHYTNSWHLGEKLGVLGFEWREAQRVISGHSSKARICKRGTTWNLHFTLL